MEQPGALVQVVVTPPGGHIPPHYHRASVEVYVVRRGVCVLIVNGERHELRVGDVVLMEPGDVHELTNRGEEEFEVLVVKTNVTGGDSFWGEATGQELLQATNEAYEALKSDLKAQQELEEELAVWDVTLMDGLEDEDKV